MSWNNKVIWTEGMFLRPQHFQQQDRHFQHWVESRSADLRPYGWGVVDLVIDEQLLSLGKLSIVSCNGVFPDGTPFRIPDDYAPPPPLEVTSDCKEEVILLALPLRKNTGRDVIGNDDPDSMGRYKLYESKIRDLHSDIGNDEAVIETGELSISIRQASQDQGAYTTIPLTKIIECRSDSQIVLDEHFIPSCLNCTGSSRLMNFVKEVQGMLHHRGESLAERLGSPGAGGVAEVVDFLLLQIVNRYDPLFNHFVGLRQLHPEMFYQILVQMAGELSTITQTNRRPSEYPAYVHTDLTPTFEPLIKIIRESLQWVPDLRAIPLPLEEHKFGVRSATVHDKELIKTANFVLAVKAQVSGDRIQSEFPHQVTIASVDKLRDLVMSHTPGVEINALAVAPRQIPYHAGFTYFELNKQNKFWKELENSGAIAMHFSGEYPGLELEFWAIKG